MNKRLLLPVLLMVILAAGVLRLWSGTGSGDERARATTARVVEVHDGDTLSIMLGAKRERVRLIGIDAPELGQRPWGNRAKDHLRRIIEGSGWSVTVEFDIEQMDKFGRTLAYLRTKDGRLINLEMLRDGYAVLLTLPPNVRHVDLFKEGQRYAREKRSGIWGKDGLKEMPRDYKREHPREPKAPPQP